MKEAIEKTLNPAFIFVAWVVLNLTSKGFQKKTLEEACRLIASPDAGLGQLSADGFDQTHQALKRFGMLKNAIRMSDFYANLT